MTRFTKHLTDLKSRISAACDAAGRNETEVSILAVSKRHGVDAVHAAYAAGLADMGENYVQEALQKIPRCSPQINWHFIGRLQSNKTRAVAENFSWVQTLTNEKVARRLSEQRPDDMPPLNVCIQVSSDADDSHGGVAPAAAAELCGIVRGLPRLRLRGLMTIPLPATDQEQQRRPFRALRELFEELQTAGYELDTLSMGMTGDLEAAILEGSTMVRIGTALFGPRPD